MQRQGAGYLLLTVKASPLYSEFFNSEWIKSPQVGFEPTTNRLTADRSTTELLRNNGGFDPIEFNYNYRVQFLFSTHDQYELEASFVTPGTSS